MPKIYTRTGDSGETALFGGGRVAKDHQRMQTCGAVDEMNALLGLARSFDCGDTVDTYLGNIQNRLFVLGAELATASGDVGKLKKISAENITQIETWIDSLEATLPPLKNFIIPGGREGHSAAAGLQLARTVCRRAERELVTLSREANINEFILKYINRLSDFLFVAARAVNHQNDIEEQTVEYD